jgi:hypothetical protein
VALKFCRYLIDAWQQRKKVRLERIRVPALVFDYPRHSGATDKGMIKRVLIFGLYSFWPRSKLVGGKIKAHRGARMAQPIKPKLGVHYKNSKEKT